MDRSTSYILSVVIAFVLISILNFFSVYLHLPFWATVIVVAAGSWFGLKWLYIKVDEEKGIKAWPLGVLAIALYMMVARALPLAEAHGEWDAWAIWNLHTKYLLDPGNWQLMMRNEQQGHPDYPLGLPSFLAFCMRCLGGRYSPGIPFDVAFATTVLIPVLIFLATYKKNFIIAATALLFMSRDLAFLNKGVSQYADTLLALLFLCAIATLKYAKNDTRYITLSAFFAASCMWIKNEGVVLATIFFLFNADTFLRPKNLRYILPAILIPLSAFVTFKLICDVPNDMIDKQKGNILDLLTDKSRYKMVYESFMNNINTSFSYLKYGIIIYLIITILGKRMLGRQFLMLVFCMATYMAFYIVTPNDLEWQLRTSQDRLIHQLLPAFIFVLAQEFSQLRFTNFKFTTIKFPKTDNGIRNDYPPGREGMLKK